MRKKSEQLEEILPISFPEGVKPEQVLRKIHSIEGRLAELITRSSGSMYFIYIHVIAFTLFFIYKPFEMGVFNIFLSLEAVFLATFIMVSQNRQALVDTYRNLEEKQEEQEEEKEQEELTEDVQDIQKDLDDIKNAMAFIQQKINALEKSPQASPDKSKN